MPSRQRLLQQPRCFQLQHAAAARVTVCAWQPTARIMIAALLPPVNPVAGRKGVRAEVRTHLTTNVPSAAALPHPRPPVHVVCRPQEPVGRGVRPLPPAPCQVIDGGGHEGVDARQSLQMSVVRCQAVGVLRCSLCCCDPPDSLPAACRRRRHHHRLICGARAAQGEWHRLPSCSALSRSSRGSSRLHGPGCRGVQMASGPGLWLHGGCRSRPLLQTTLACRWSPTAWPLLYMQSIKMSP